MSHSFEAGEHRGLKRRHLITHGYYTSAIEALVSRKLEQPSLSILLQCLEGLLQKLVGNNTGHCILLTDCCLV
jgi:hypothetical protein